MSSDGMTTSKLIQSIENRSHVPVNQDTFTKFRFLDFATEEMRLTLTPFIMLANEDYFLFEIEVPFVNGQLEYPIPSRAAGVKLKDLQLKDSSGNYRELTRITIGDRFGNEYGQAFYYLNQFYIKNNKVVFLGNNNINYSNYKLVFVIYIRPSQLVLEDRVGVISSINRSNNTIVVDQIPEVFTTQQTYDFYKASSPFNVVKIDFNVLSLNTTTNTITVESIPDEIDVGDHISLSNEASIPQVPEEFHAMLAQMVACRLMESQGDTEGLRNAMTKLQQMKDDSGYLIDNRVTNAPKKVRNRFGFLRNPFGRFYYRR